MQAYSEDRRRRILAAVDAGMAKGQAARIFGVSRSTIKRYAQQRRATGSLAPKPPAAGPPFLIGPADHDALRAQVAAAPAARLVDHCATWEQAQGVAVSVATMHRAIARLRWTRKKRPWRPRNGTKRRAPPGEPR